MKALRTGIVVSIIFHLAILIFFYFYYLPWQPWSSPAIIMEWERVESMPKPPVASGQEISKPKAEWVEMKQTLLKEEKIVIPAAEDTHRTIKDTTRIFYFAPESYSKFWFRPESLHASHRDTLQSLAKRPLALLPSKGTAMRFDRVGNDLYLRNHGQPPLLPLDAIMGALAKVLTTAEEKPKTIHLTSVPSPAEIATLAIIYQLDKPTQYEIYAAMDSSIKMTAEDVDIILEELTLKGYLTRELISPRDEFQIMTPMGTVGLEKNSLNRRNRVYRYQQILERDHLMNFLQAQWYNAKNRGETKTVERIESLIYLLIAR